MVETLSRGGIPYSHWSMAVGRRASALGAIVSQYEDLEQGIANLVLTPIGSVPTEPEKGCDIAPFIDRNENEAIAGLTEAIWEGLHRWHPRIVVGSVQVLPAASDDGSRMHWATDVFWRPRADVDAAIRQTRITLEAGATLQVAL